MTSSGEPIANASVIRPTVGGVYSPIGACAPRIGSAEMSCAAMAPPPPTVGYGRGGELKEMVGKTFNEENRNELNEEEKREEFIVCLKEKNRIKRGGVWVIICNNLGTIQGWHRSIRPPSIGDRTVRPTWRRPNTTHLKS